MPSRSFPPPPPPPNPIQNHPSSFLKPKVLFLALTISATLLILIAIFFFLLYLYHTLLNRSKKTIPFDSTPSSRLHRFSYNELKSATHFFSDANSVGKGGSGTVFRGILRDGKSVAVKVLDTSSSLQAEREFRNELNILGGLRRSPFVVSLLGYCVEKKRRRFLVYEYMPNRSLQELLFGEGAAAPAGWVLTWEQRFEIVLDVARALAFLHLECDPPVIHGDIKPSNVLLGSDYRAKISDFGLSRVKVEGEFGVDLFSQELGRSQELWKSQELSGNPATGVETPVDEPSKTEVDFAFAVQASSSATTTTTCFSKKNIIDCNNNSNNVKRLDLNSNGNTNDLKGGSYKGKEVFGGCDVDGEYWNKLASYDDELYSIDHSRELNVNASSPPTDYDPRTKQWGKDWWWRQDGSGKLCSKDYVMEWIGSQIYSSRNPDWDEESKTVSPGKPDHYIDSSTLSEDKLETRNEALFEEIGFESNPKRNISGKREAKGSKGGKKKHRKMQEWWKEENLAEITKKGSKLRKLEAQFKKGGFKVLHFDLGRKFRIFRKGNSFTDKNQNGSDQNLEFSFRKGFKKKKKNANSTGSDMWSGDLLSRELSSTTSMRGTVCYVAPEYGGCGYLMEKADIYSLGVLILVIVSGRRPLHVLSSPMKLEKANLISWCRQLSQSGNVLELVDERLKSKYNKEQATLCINLALLCLQKMPELRPDIGDIVKILKGEMDLPALPIEFSPSPPSKLLSRSRRKKMKVEVE